ncbi:MAG TPA: hypothetical protein PKB12_09390, partial [Elusimicrobiota bacterium]|nr:hypothetical protein [Elusimicrobiota bacterium]
MTRPPTLAAETAAEPQLAMVKALQALKVWNDATLDALAGVATRAGGGLARDNAVRTLIEASADPAFPSTAEDKIVAALADIAPSGSGAEDKRTRLLEAFKEG